MARRDATPVPPTGSPGVEASAAGRALTLTYGVVAYGLFLATFLYLVGFLGGFPVPKDINAGTASPLATAILVNLAVLSVFAVQHTIMARIGFKKWWTTVVPRQVERSTFVLVTCACLALIVAQWRPLPTVVWEVGGFASGLIQLAFWAGWVIVLVSTFLIDHFDLFGLKQTWSYASGREVAAGQFRERLFYRFVRHPLMLGFAITFWATPVMTQGRLLFAAVVTGYIIIAIRIEEATLVGLHGDRYRDYQRRVPALVPLPFRRSG